MDWATVLIVILLVVLALVVLDTIYKSSKRTVGRGVYGSYARVIGGDNNQYLTYYRMQEKAICNAGNRGFYTFVSANDLNAEEAAVRKGLGDSMIHTPAGSALEKGTWNGGSLTWVPMNDGASKRFIRDLIFSRLHPLTKIDVPELRQILTNIRNCIDTAAREADAEVVAPTPAVATKEIVETVVTITAPTPPVPAPLDDEDFAQEAAERLGITSSESRSAQLAAVSEAAGLASSAKTSPEAWHKSSNSDNEKIQTARRDAQE